MEEKAELEQIARKVAYVSVWMYSRGSSIACRGSRMTLSVIKKNVAQIANTSAADEKLSDLRASKPARLQIAGALILFTKLGWIRLCGMFPCTVVSYYHRQHRNDEVKSDDKKRTR